MQDSFIFILSNEWSINQNREDFCGIDGMPYRSILISTTYEWRDFRGVFHSETRLPCDAPLKFFPYNLLTLEPL